MLGVPIVNRQSGPEGVQSENRLRVKNAPDRLEIRRLIEGSSIHHFEGRGITIGPGNDLFFGAMLVIGGVVFDIELTPTVFLGDVSAAEIETVGGRPAEVLEFRVNYSNITLVIAYVCGVSWPIKLRIWIWNQSM